MTMTPADYGFRECPDCEGEGMIYTADGEPNYDMYNDDAEDCPTCDGTGQVRI